jgi:Flp pilus assembly protein TadG
MPDYDDDQDDDVYTEFERRALAAKYATFAAARAVVPVLATERETEKIELVEPVVRDLYQRYGMAGVCSLVAEFSSFMAVSLVGALDRSVSAGKDAQATMMAAIEAYERWVLDVEDTHRLHAPPPPDPSTS